MNAKTLKSYMTLHKLVARKFKEANHQQFKVWASMGSATLIFAGFDEELVPIYPQIRNSIMAKGHVGDALQMASYQGYNSDLCAELRCDIGNQHIADNTRTSLPPPDFILGMNFTCGASVGLYDSWLKQFTQADHYLIDTPAVTGEYVSRNTVAYVRQQFAELIEMLEKRLQIDFDMEKFRKAAVLSSKSLNMMNQIIQLAAHNPSPICLTSFQPFLLPLAYYTHYQDTYDYFVALKSEIEEIIKTNSEKKEKIRLCWDFLPLYKYMNDIKELISDHDAKIVIGTSLTSALEWPMPELFENTNDPLSLLAFAYVQHHFKRNYQYKAKHISQWIHTHELDGIIFHSARCCKVHSLPHFLVKEELEQQFKIPTLVIEADVLDTRAYSKSQVLNRMEAFLEALEARAQERHRR